MTDIDPTAEVAALMVGLREYHPHSARGLLSHEANVILHRLDEQGWSLRAPEPKDPFAAETQIIRRWLDREGVDVGELGTSMLRWLAGMGFEFGNLTKFPPPATVEVNLLKLKNPKNSEPMDVEAVLGAARKIAGFFAPLFKAHEDVRSDIPPLPPINLGSKEQIAEDIKARVMGMANQRGGIPEWASKTFATKDDLQVSMDRFESMMAATSEGLRSWTLQLDNETKEWAKENLANIRGRLDDLQEHKLDAVTPVPQDDGPTLSEDQVGQALLDLKDELRTWVLDLDAEARMVMEKIDARLNNQGDLLDQVQSRLRSYHGRLDSVIDAVTELGEGLDRVGSREPLQARLASVIRVMDADRAETLALAKSVADMAFAQSGLRDRLVKLEDKVDELALDQEGYHREVHDFDKAAREMMAKLEAQVTTSSDRIGNWINAQGRTDGTVNKLKAEVKDLALRFEAKVDPEASVVDLKAWLKKHAGHDADVKDGPTPGSIVLACRCGQSYGLV